jgi:hypothetical protein
VLDVGQWSVRGQIHTWTLYHQRKEPSYLLNRRLGVFQSWSEHFGEEIYLYTSYPCWELNHDSSDIQPIAWTLL